MGGVGLRSLTSMQGQAQIKLLLQHIRTDSPLGKLLVISLQWYHRFSGTTEPPLWETSRPLHYVPGRWIQSLRTFLRETQSQIQIPNQMLTSSPRRLGDVNLMDYANTLDYTPKTLETLNHCRLHLRAEYLSDVCNAQGTRLSIHNDQSPCFISFPTSEDSWPRQPPPEPPYWQAWHRFLREHFGCSSKSSYLKKSLGKWTAAHLRIGTTYLDPLSSRVVHFTNRETKRIYKVTTKHRTRWSIAFEKTSTDDHHIRNTWIPVDLFGNDQVSAPVYDSQPRSFTNPTNTHSPDSPTMDLQGHSTWEANLIQRQKAVFDRNKVLAMSKRASRFVIAARGHKRRQSGTYLWTIGTEHTPIWEGNGSTQGLPLTPYRLETYEITAGLTVLRAILEQVSRITTQVPVVLYSARGLQRLTKASHLLDRTQTHDLPDQDITATFRQVIIPYFPLTTIHSPIKKKERRANPGVARLLDHVQKTKNPKQVTTYTPYQPPPAQRVQILLRDQPLTANETYQLGRHLSRRNMQQFLSQRYNWSANAANQVDWESRNKALRLATPAMRMFLIKLTSGTLPTGSRLHRIDESINPLCHDCGEPETTAHLFLCSCREEWRLDLGSGICAELVQKATTPRLQLRKKLQIGAWFHSPRPPDPEDREQ